MSLLTNIVSYWKLDGNSNDSVGALNGTDNSIDYDNAYGKINNGARFNASSDKITFGTTSLISGTSDFTLAFWLYYSSGVFIISRRASSPPTTGWQFVYNAGAFYFTDSGGSNVFQSAGITATVGDWQHMVITRSGSNWTLYKDGVSVDTDTNGNSLATGASLTFGDTGDGGGSAVMYLDEVGVWSRALDSGEVSSLYNSGTGLQYPFGESLGGSASTLLMMGV